MLRAVQEPFLIIAAGNPTDYRKNFTRFSASGGDVSHDPQRHVVVFLVFGKEAIDSRMLLIVNKNGNDHADN